MKYILIVTNPIDEVEVIPGFATEEAAWEKADELDYSNKYNANFSYEVIPDIVSIIKAHKQCVENTGCDGCPYDGICATRSCALDRDTVVALRAFNALINPT